MGASIKSQRRGSILSARGLHAAQTQSVSLWKTELSPAAQRDYRKLDRQLKQEALQRIEDLTIDGPALPGAIEMRANPDTWRVRFHRYRMIYQISRTRKYIRITFASPGSSCAPRPAGA